MRKSKLTLLGIIILSCGFLTACDNESLKNNNGNLIMDALNYENVIEYNDSLMNISNQCITLEDEQNIRNLYNNYKPGEQINQIQTLINNIISKCEDTLAQIDSIGNREGDSSLKDSVILVIEKHIARYKKLNETLPYLEKSSLTDKEKEDYNKIYQEIQNLDNEFLETNNNLGIIQKNFAKNYGFELEK